MTNLLCIHCKIKNQLIFGADGVFCKKCRKLEDWESFHKRYPRS